MVFPEIRWAQRSNETDAAKNVLYLTVAVPNLSTYDADYTTTSFKFTGKDDSNEYAVSFDFYADIDVENSHKVQNGQGIFFVLRKKEAQQEYWPRLTKDKVRKPYIKTDFDKWADEDEQETAEEPDMGAGGPGGPGGFDMSSLMGGAGGAGGPGGFDMSSLMGGAGGAGGAGGFDMSSLMGGAGGAGSSGGNEDLEALLKQAGKGGSGGDSLDELLGGSGAPSGSDDLEAVLKEDGEGEASSSLADADESLPEKAK